MKTPEILIISSEEDSNFKAITEWLSYYNANFFPINIYRDILSIDSYDMQNKNMLLSITNSAETHQISLENVKTVFIRNGQLKLRIHKIPEYLKQQDSIRDYLYCYHETLDGFLEYFFMQNFRVIGLWSNAFINKLLVLEEAMKIGFTIPETFLKTDVATLALGTSYISKTLGAPLLVDTKMEKFITYTGRVTDIPKQKKFMTSLIQKEVKKLFEIRVFVFLKRIYSMAIFSQMNKQSEVDYRIYSDENPYLEEPFSLPKAIQEKIFKLMEVLKLTTGSFDFMYSDSQEYYFLEVNPIGQFGHLGNVCGINLDRVIAEEIIRL